MKETAFAVREYELLCETDEREREGEQRDKGGGGRREREQTVN